MCLPAEAQLTLPVQVHLTLTINALTTSLPASLQLGASVSSHTLGHLFQSVHLSSSSEHSDLWKADSYKK